MLKLLLGLNKLRGKYPHEDLMGHISSMLTILVVIIWVCPPGSESQHSAVLLGLCCACLLGDTFELSFVMQRDRAQHD